MVRITFTFFYTLVIFHCKNKPSWVILNQLIKKGIINETDSDLVNILFSLESVNTNTKLIQKYSVFQLIFFSRQKGSPANYFENETMSIIYSWTQFLNYFHFTFWFSYLYTVYILLIIFTLPCYRYRQGLARSAVFKMLIFFSL